MNNILHQVPSESKIKRELKGVLFGKGRLFCPRCGSPQIKPCEKRYRCKICRKPFSLTSINWLKSMKLPLQTFWLLLWSWTNKAPLDQAVKLCGISEPTARRWYEKFRDRLPQESLDNIRLSGIVQMDEAYRGGKKKGFSIVAAKEKSKRGDKRKMVIRIIPKPSVDRKDAIEFLVQSVAPDSNLHTDGSSIYKGINKWWPVNHRFEIHSKWEFALTSEIEGLFGNLTTFIRRMYHHVTKEKVGDVAKEFLARSVYPEWFICPSSFLEIAFQRISRPARVEWRGQYQRKQNQRKIRTSISLNYSFIYLPKRLSTVPS